MNRNILKITKTKNGFTSTNALVEIIYLKIIDTLKIEKDLIKLIEALL